MEDYCDADGYCICVGDQVEMPDPNDTDIYSHSFVGTVVDLKICNGEDYIVVEDGDGDCFDIESFRVTILD